MNKRLVRGSSAAMIAALSAGASLAAPAHGEPANLARPTVAEPATAVSGPGRAYVVRVAGGRSVGEVLTGHRILADLSGAAFHGALVQLTPAQADTLRDAPAVVAVRPNRTVSLTETASVAAASATPGWGADRADQRQRPLDHRYAPPLTAEATPATGAGVDVYVVDTGIAPSSEFANLGAGYTAIDDSTTDCNGHGTHVAGTIGSSRYGMAPGVTLHPVRVLDCRGNGDDADVLAALNWIAARADPGSVVNMSLGGPRSGVLNRAVAALTRQGITVAVAAGNSAADACTESPGSSPAVLTVSAVNRSDHEAWFANYGRCVDIFAPGVGVVSTNFHGSGGLSKDGTSMATPHVSAAAALYLQLHPGAGAAEVEAAIIGRATRGVLSVPKHGASRSPNLLLNVRFDLPSEVTAVTATPRNRALRVAWQPPAYPGSGPLSYTATARPGNASCTTTGASCVIRGLANDGRYRVEVVASTDAGAGDPATSPAVAPVAVPTTPTVRKVVVRGSRVVVRWRPASAPAAAPVTRYRVHATSGAAGCTAAGTARRCTVGPLGGATSYRFTVRARNVAGWSAPSAVTRAVELS